MPVDYVERPIKARQPWLWKPMTGRAGIIAGVTIHATRGGTAASNEGPACEGWFNNPNNVQDGGLWGAFSDAILFADGTRVICTNHDHEYATWTAGYGARAVSTWPMGHYYIQIECAQGTNDQPYDPRLIDSLAQYVAYLARKYDFPIVRLPFIEQTEYPIPRGISGHDSCANGRVTGKTDPGKMFPWDDFLARASQYLNGEEDELSAEQVTRIDRLEADHTALKADYTALARAVFSGGEDPTADDAKRAEDVAYRIAQRTVGVEGQPPTASVADNAASAIKVVADLAHQLTQTGGYTPADAIAEIIRRLQAAQED